MVDQIRTERCPLYMLTGEYDYAPFPHETIKTAESIPDAKVTIMKDAGHFPMSENYGSFNKYLLPILDELSAGSR
jgi:pimeloyl-ACP methyl ester carboxylesterase